MLHWSKATAPAGDRVVAGTHVDMGEITVRVEKIGDETRMGSIIQMIESEEALDQRPCARLFLPGEWDGRAWKVFGGLSEVHQSS